jgi:hypothetical protein
MTRLTVDAGIHTKLATLTAPVELCDDKGRVIGRFFPVLDPALYDNLECPLSREELDRRKREKGKTYTTEEVLAMLEKR